MKKKEKIGIGVLAFIAIFSFSIFILTSNITLKEYSPPPLALVNKIEKMPNIARATESKKSEKTATLEIGDKKYESEIHRETSVYDFMTKLKKEGKINFKDINYIGMGKFIEELNGVKGNGDKFWIYYVNNKKAKIGVSNYKINPGDVVSWKYEMGVN